MVSKNELYIIQCYAKLAAHVGIIPRSEWVETTKLLHTSENPTKSQIFLNVLHLSSFSYWTGLSIWRVQRTYYELTGKNIDDDKPEAEGVSFSLLQMIYILDMITWVGTWILYLGFICYKESLLQLMSQLWVFSKTIGLASKSPKYEKYVIYFNYIYLYLILSTAIVLSLIEVHFIWIVTSSYVCCIVTGLIFPCFMISVIVLYTFLQSYIFMYFKIIKSSLVITNPAESRMNHHKIQTMLQTYNSLTILSNNFNSSYCLIIVPVMKYVCCQMIMFFIVVGVHFRKQQQVTTTTAPMNNLNSDQAFLDHVDYIAHYFNLMTPPLMLIVGLEIFVMVGLGARMCSQVWEISQSYILGFKCAGNNVDDAKFIKALSRSLKSLRFGVGGLYYMESEAKLTLMDFIVNGTVDLLITFQ